jgi:hypothetical protein
MAHQSKERRIMPKRKKPARPTTRPAKHRTRGPRKDEETFEAPPDPAATNHDPLESRGTRKSVPGAGLVRDVADAGPAPEETGDYPGTTRDGGRAASPGAQRPGTTRSGVAATPSAGGAGRARSGRPTATETASDGGGAPLSVLGQIDKAPRGSSAGAPEIADPNFPITHGQRPRHNRRGKSPRR